MRFRTYAENIKVLSPDLSVISMCRSGELRLAFTE